METYTCGERQPASRQDYQQYDRIWQRVSPELTPYPDLRGARAPTQTTVASTAMAPPAVRLETLPGAIADPCCMGTQAQQSLGVLQGFVDEECRQRTVYLAQVRRQLRPGRAALLRRMAEQSLQHIQQLMTAYYLITGQCLRPVAQQVNVSDMTWCDLLRASYHEEVCDRFNYMRASEEALDPCVKELFSRLADASQAQAEVLFDELSRHMCRQRR